MKVLAVIDSFKGSLTSAEAGNAVKDALFGLSSTVRVRVRPLADGGEGTVDAMLSLPGSREVRVSVTGPVGVKTEAKYCVLKDGTAVMETASAAGLPLVPADMRDPELTTTLGVGEMIRHAIENGYRNFLIGLGGSATNDGGIGMLSALGFEFQDEDGKSVEPCARGLSRLTNVYRYHAMRELKECRFSVACDVTNPLCGPNGCSAVFAPQKGAGPESASRMDGWLKNYAKLASDLTGADMDMPGAGAAGGLGFAFSAFLGAKLERGAKLIFRLTELEKYIEEADIVVTGEGRIDGQTIMGKAPFEAAKLAKKKNKPVIAFCGCAGDGAELTDGFFDGVFPIVRGAVSLEDAMKRENAYGNLRYTAYQVFKTVIKLRPDL